MDLYYRFRYWDNKYKIALMYWWEADRQYFVFALGHFGIARWTNAHLGKELKRATMLEF